MLECPFCALATRQLLHHSPLVAAFADAHPVTPGHTLVAPRRHAETYFELTPDEQAALWSAVAAVKAHLDATLIPAPDGYNVGFNVHEAAGQTVPHAHVHVIPRYRGDVPNPRGGVRWVIPHKADYKLDWNAETPQDVADVAAGPLQPLAPWLLADLSRATRIDIAVAFVWPPGLQLVLPRLEECLERGGAVRFLTGDYQELTAPDALRMLLDLTTEFERMRLRIVETTRVGQSFHPKAYLLSNEGTDGGSIVYVGSSNLSEQALHTGHEWNVRLQGVAGVRRAQLAFDQLFTSEGTTEVTHEWVDAYEKRREARRPRPGQSDVFVFDEPARKPFEPHTTQREALDTLARTREAGNGAGLVVLATGLGKTWLAAFDSEPFKRVLFVAHRDEILRQAMHTFRSIRPKDRFGLYTGAEKHRGANVLFASVQTLARENHLKQFHREYFDYIIIDEFHHASARTYRSLIQHFTPSFLLGLTATPDRSDGGDLLDLCDGNLVYRCDLGRGIAAGHLCPFHYHGVPDLVDYENIPWRSHRFDEQQLSEAVETTQRAQNALEQWHKHAGPGSRTIGFCVSQRHADFMRQYFRNSGLRAASVHSNQPTSDPRAESLDKLERGEIDIIFAVDMFNEGLDIKNVDAVLMLRPTESRTLWLQQIGRGLRKCEGKQRLQIIDYIGNHRVFLQKPAALLGALGIDIANPAEIPYVLRKGSFDDALPPGCAVTYELQTIEILEKLFPATRSLDAMAEWYRGFVENNGCRPTALQALRARRNPRATVRTHGSWLAFVESECGLDQAARRARSRNATFLHELETTRLSSGDEMFLLEALLSSRAIPGSVRLDDLAACFVRLCKRSGQRRSEVSINLDDIEEVKHRLVDKPISAWTRRRDPGGLPYFDFSGDVFCTDAGIRPADSEVEASAFADLVTEIVDWRIAQYFIDKSNASARSARVTAAQDAPADGGYRVARTLIKRDDGTPVDAQVLVEELDGESTVVVLSRGAGRNNQYSQGVEILLERLGKLGGKVERIAVESGATTTLNLEGRTVEIEGFTYPIDPAGTEPKRLRIAIGTAVAAIGRAPGAKGSGNANKRIRIWVSGVDHPALDRAVMGPAAS